MDKAAVIIPVLNEEKAIQQVVKNVPKQVCGLKTSIHVIDGGSNDSTCEKVDKTSADLIHQTYKGGKGGAIREALGKIEADVYVFIDGDMTYPSDEMDKIVEPLVNSDYDHVLGSRLNQHEEDAFMLRNLIGNKVYSWFFRKLSNSQIEDFLTGYRALTQDLIDDLVLETKGFEIETELTLKTLQLDKKIKEVDITYSSRIGDSKLEFASDGPKILSYAVKTSLFN